MLRTKSVGSAPLALALALAVAAAATGTTLPPRSAYANGGGCDLILAPQSGATGVPTNTLLMAGFLAFEAYLYDDTGTSIELTAETRDAVVIYTPMTPLLPNLQYFFQVAAGLQGGPDSSFTTGPGPDDTAPAVMPVVSELFGSIARATVPCRTPGNLGVNLSAPVPETATIALYLAPEGQPIDPARPYMFGLGSALELVEECSYAFPAEGVYDVSIAVLGANGMPGPLVSAGTLDLTKHRGCAVLAPGRGATGAGALVAGFLSVALVLVLRRKQADARARHCRAPGRRRRSRSGPGTSDFGGLRPARGLPYGGPSPCTHI